MAQTLEKVFLQKVSHMPKEECDVTAVTTKGQVKERKTNAGTLRKKISNKYLSHPLLL